MRASLLRRGRRRSLRTFSGLLTIALTACVPNRAYRDLPPANATVQRPFVPGIQLPQYEPHSTAHPFDFSYIEFDEKGDYWDRRQLGWTVQQIKEVVAADNMVLIVYVHGWQNNASTSPNHDVGKFHCLLEHLVAADGGQHRFFGVYIGWRGKSVPGGDEWFRRGTLPAFLAKAFFFVPHELSLYSRKSAATRVAGLPVTEAIFQSVAAARNGASQTGHKARTILIGHSFGALLLEKAIGQALAAQIISNNSAHGGEFIAPADFVVLLNSAAESIYAKEMIDLLRRRQPSASKDSNSNEISARHPLIVSITSTGDSATGSLFPIGVGLSNLFGMFRKYEWDNRYGDSSHNVSQRDYFNQTPGHNKKLISYRAVPHGSPSAPVYEESDECRPEMMEGFRRNLRETLVGPNGEVQFLTTSASGVTEWQLEPTIEDRLQTPYWIVEVPKEIIRNHSDIFNENALGLMARLFRVVNPQDARGISTTGPRRMRLSEPGYSR